MESARRKIIAHTYLPKILQESKDNTDEHLAEPGSAYLLNQAFTRVMAEKPTNQLQRTMQLTTLLDEKTGFQTREASKVYQTADTTDDDGNYEDNSYDVPF